MEAVQWLLEEGRKVEEAVSRKEGGGGEGEKAGDGGKGKEEEGVEGPDTRGEIKRGGWTGRILQRWPWQLFEGAVKGGHMSILLWAKDQGLCPFYLFNSNSYSSNDLEILKWLKKEGYLKLSQDHVSGAIGGGHVDILNWIMSEAPKLRDQISKDIFLLIQYYARAGTNNRAEVLQWLRNNFKIPPPGTFSQLARQGNFEMLKSLYPDFEKDWNGLTCEIFCRDNFGMLKWARKHGCPWGTETLSKVAKSGNFEIFRWARDQGCPWGPSTCSSAASSGSFEILKWARENRCPWSSNTCYAATCSGNSEILKWVWEHGCPWDQHTCSNAASNGNLEMLKWAREHEAPWDMTTCLEAIRKNHIEILDWVFMNECPCNPREIIGIAAKTGSLSALNWAKQKLPKESFSFIARLAVEENQLHVLTWMKENRIPFPDDFLPFLIDSSHARALFVGIKINLPAEFHGVWREVDEILETFYCISVIEVAREVLGGTRHVEEFIELVKNLYGGL
jgi:hypothetical protein